MCFQFDNGLVRLIKNPAANPLFRFAAVFVFLPKPTKMRNEKTKKAEILPTKKDNILNIY